MRAWQGTLNVPQTKQLGCHANRGLWRRSGFLARQLDAGTRQKVASYACLADGHRPDAAARRTVAPNSKRYSLDLR